MLEEDIKKLISIFIMAETCAFEIDNEEALIYMFFIC